MRVRILGCGASAGVPMVGCSCLVCTSGDPKNKRTRVSILIEKGDRRILVDTSPDLRQQCLSYNINKIDAVLYTHDHADHTHGIDDVRSFNYTGGAPISAWGDEQTLQTMKQRFAYVFKPPVTEFGWFRPALIPELITPYKCFSIGGIEVMPFEQLHGGEKKTLGLRFGDFAYSTDVKAIPDKSFELLKGVKVWVVDCLKYTPVPTHAHLALTLEWIERVQPEKAYLTHMSHDFEYERLKAELPPNVEPAYDGLIIDIP